MIKDIVARLIRLEKVVHSMRLNVSGGLSIKKSPYGTMLIGPGRSSGGGGAGVRRLEIKTNQADNAASTVAFLIDSAGTTTETEVTLNHLPTKANVDLDEWALSSGAASLEDGDKVLAGQTPEGDWYLISPMFIKYCAAE